MKVSIIFALTVFFSAFSLQARNEDSYLLQAIQKGWTKVAKQLLERGADVNEKDISGNTVLMYAIKDDVDFRMIELLVQAGGDPNIKDRVGNTALTYAIRINSEIRLIKLLVSAGIDPDIKDWSGNTALDLAEFFDRTRVIELLRRMGSNINDLMLAIDEEDLEAVKEIVATGINLNVKDSRGYTPLTCAKLTYNIDIIKILTGGGAISNRYSSVPDNGNRCGVAD